METMVLGIFRILCVLRWSEKFDIVGGSGDSGTEFKNVVSK